MDRPAILQRWWTAAPTWVSPSCDVDPRVGGRYVLRMRDDRTRALHVVAGERREIDRPSRLVYTWAWQAEDGTARPLGVVPVEFRADGDRTTVVLEHGGLPSEESVDITRRAGPEPSGASPAASSPSPRDERSRRDAPSRGPCAPCPRATRR